MPRSHTNTRENLLQAALKRFAEQGYRNTHTQDICRDAHANIAAVNYHFGGKEGLYKAVWDCALEHTVQIEEGTQRLSSDHDREWLYKYVRACVMSVFETGVSSALRKLMVHEISDPSPISQELLTNHLAPHYTELTERLRRMLGPGVTDYQIGCCIFAINSQFTALAINRVARRMLFRNETPTPLEAEKFTREICAFVMGGIRAIRATPPRP